MRYYKLIRPFDIAVSGIFMGIYDRDYTRTTSGSAGYGYNINSIRPSMTPIVKYLLIINIVVFVVENILDPNYNFITPYFAVVPKDWWQLWRLVTYQFLHANGFHIFCNMLGLFFFGPMIERVLGSKKFLRFYLICGASGGLLYPLLAAMGLIEGVYPMVGASGSVYGLLVAAAIMFPGTMVYVYGIIPVRIVILVLIFLVMSIMGIFKGCNAGGEAAHLAGLAAGALMVLGQPWLSKRKIKKQKGSWQNKMEYERNFQKEVDRILEKVHTEGMTSLTRKEKKILKIATEREQHPV